MKGKAKLEDFPEDEQKSIKNGLDAIDELKEDLSRINSSCSSR